MAGSASVDTEPGPFAARVIDWHWTRPVAIACGVFAVLLGGVYAVHSLASTGPVPDSKRAVLGLSSQVRVDIVLSFVTAYTLATGLLGLARATAEFDKLRPLLHLDEAGRREFRARLAPRAQVLLKAGLIGGLLGISLDLLPYFATTARQPDLALHSAPFMFLLFGLLGVQATGTIRQSQVFYDLGRTHLQLDLLDLETLTPFSAVGLGNAAFWFIGSALASFLVANDANVWIVVLVITATVGLGIVGLLFPSRGLHLSIGERKREELARIRSAIAGEREGLFSAKAETAPGSRMPSLLAYEARIEGVREWPFDTTTLSRFGLFLLIPVVSWIGGALVERLVDAALG